MSIKVTTGVPESEQESSFMNATLQGAGGKVAFSVAVHVAVPVAVYADGEQKVAEWLKAKLSPLAVDGVDVEVRVGPSCDAEDEEDEEDGGVADARPKTGF